MAALIGVAIRAGRDVVDPDPRRRELEGGVSDQRRSARPGNAARLSGVAGIAALARCSSRDRRTGAGGACQRAADGRARARHQTRGTAAVRALPLLPFLLAGLPSATLGAGAARVWSNDLTGRL